MGKAKSLRSQITIFMTILVALQSIALLVCLVVSQVFTILDAESVRLFYDTVNNRAKSFSYSMTDLVVNMANETNDLAAAMVAVAAQSNLNATELSENETAHDKAMRLATEKVLSFLGSHDVTGAFVALDSSYYRPGEHAHSMVYVRNTVPSTHSVDYSHYMLEVGPTWASTEYQIPMSSNWTMDYQSAEIFNEEDNSLYHTPVDAAWDNPGGEIERYGYWASPSNVLGDGETVITYTMPLVGAKGVPFGVFGFEISVNYLNQTYMPSNELPFTNSFYAVVKTPSDNELGLSWFIPSGTLAQIYLRSLDNVHLASTRHQTLLQTNLPELGDMYISAQELEMYSRNSPFAERGWSLVAFVGTDALNETSTNVRNLLLGSLAITTAIAFVGVFTLAFVSTRNIRGLSSRIKRINRYDSIAIGRTGFAEVDDLIQQVEILNRRVANAGQRISKIMDLTEMPIGCFELLEDEVYLTDQVYPLLGLQDGCAFTLEEWQKTLEEIKAKPEAEFEGVYYWPVESTDRWLRVLTTESDTGTVGLITDVTDQVEERRRLSQQLDFDPMTGLFNRNAFKREAQACIKNKPEGIGALIFADLDNLKFINDTYGHESGDVLLKSAGEMFDRFSRHGGVVARIAGDEFAIYLHGEQNQDQLREVIDGVVQTIRNNSITTPDGVVHRVRFSAGIAWYPQNSEDVTDLIKLADFAMYEAKHKRKGTISEFDPQTYQETSFLLENSETINRLLDERLIRFDFQPIVSLKTGEIYGYEALMRSKIPEFKSPLDIISVASAQSKLYQVEKLVSHELFGWVNKRCDSLGDVKIFMNSLPSQPVTVEDVDLLKLKFPNALAHIVVEITEDENTPMRMLTEKLEVIREFGFPIAIDDFGAGYSNELRILSLQPDFVKIDMAIVQGVSQEDDKCMLMTSIISFCKAKGIRTIAEGVETADDLRKIMDLGVDYVQGYFAGKPAPELQPALPQALEVIHQHADIEDMIPHI